MLDIVVIIACSLCGFAVGKYFERRVKTKNNFYGDLNKYIVAFGINIDGKQLEADKFNVDFASRCSDSFAKFLFQRKFPACFSGAEQTEIRLFADSLNAVSSSDLKKSLQYYGYVFSEKGKDVAAQSAKSSVYVKLGILLGVMAGIVLV